jgi:UDP-N-acetyl-D-mannosaminuronic acid dehydrogenase
MREQLLAAIENKTAKVVVIGLGYVGLPVACLFADVGFSVIGLDLDSDKISKISRGICPIEGKEPELPELLARVVKDGNLEVTTDYRVCKQSQIILIAVETPVNPNTHKPTYQALRAALTDLGKNLSQNTLVIVESTIAPGTMSKLVQPILENHSGLQVDKDFYLVNCPERVMPGKLLRNMRTISRVVGGSSLEAANLAIKFYKHVVSADLDPVDCITAEIVKTVENTYRDVQIAFANEVALICEEMGADAWQVRKLVNKSPGHYMLFPGAGVGGHCIPKDPWLLIANTKGIKPRLIPTARDINEYMPIHVANLTIAALKQVGVKISESRVAVLGYSYLENTDDSRNSPSIVLVSKLKELGVEIRIHDPFVKAYQGDLKKIIQECDAMIIMVAHDEYRELDLSILRDLMSYPILIDGRHLFDPIIVESMGWVYWGVGIANI